MIHLMKKKQQEQRIMLRSLGVFCICLTTFPVLCQSISKYQAGTITSVQTHLAPGDSVSDAVSYDVSIKVSDTIYVVLYTPPLGLETVKSAAGRDCSWAKTQFVTTISWIDRLKRP